MTIVEAPPHDGTARYKTLVSASDSRGSSIMSKWGLSMANRPEHILAF